MNQHISQSKDTALVSLSPNTNNLPPNWRVVQLGAVAREFISGGTPSTKQPGFWDGSIAWTTSAPIAEEDISLSHAQRFITQDGLKNSASHLVPKGNLLVGTRVGVGKAVVNLIDVAISQDLTGVVFDTSQVDTEFVAYQCKTEKAQQFFHGRKRGATIKGISRFDLESLILYVPSLPEQQAIAHTLKTVQEAREARQREITLERERKAALMQHLFTHGTQHESHKQTEIGEMPESWQVTSLGDIAEIAYGLTVNQERRQSTNPAPYLAVANVTRGAIRLDEVKQIGMLNGDAEKYRLKKGDVLLVEGNGNPKLLGSAAVWNDELPFALHQNHLIRARLDQSSAVPEWVMYYLNSDAGRAQLLGKAKTSSGLHSINSSLIAGLRIPLPSREEQETTTNIFRSCEEVIAGLDKEAVLLDELFRAMLEELMTGRLSAGPLVNESPNP